MLKIKESTIKNNGYVIDEIKIAIFSPKKLFKYALIIFSKKKISPKTMIILIIKKKETVNKLFTKLAGVFTLYKGSNLKEEKSFKVRGILIKKTIIIAKKIIKKNI